MNEKMEKSGKQDNRGNGNLENDTLDTSGFLDIVFFIQILVASKTVKFTNPKANIQ